MTTEAFVGNVFFERGNGATPEVFTRICQVRELSGIGQTNDLIDVTTFCSAGSREYIGGLADGEEITVGMNYETSSTQIAAMISDVDSKATRNYRLVIDSGSPSQIISFAAASIGWVLSPAVDDANQISFTLKISGDITIA